MKIKRSIKRMLELALWSILTISFIIILSAASRKHTSVRLLPEPQININFEAGLYFIDQQEVKDIIFQSLSNALDSYTIEELDLDKIEKNILSNPYIRSADAFVDMQGKLKVNIIQREPIARVINRNGVSYYIDNYGERIPISSKFTARVPVCTGDIFDNYGDAGELAEGTLKDLYFLAKYIHKDKYLFALTEQIEVNGKGQFEIIPKIENHAILLGDVDNLDEKFRKLFIFYKEGLKNVGLNKYTTIDLRFKDQVVCKKRSI